MSESVADELAQVINGIVNMKKNKVSVVFEPVKCEMFHNII